jgi:hypothetical protein
MPRNQGSIVSVHVTVPYEQIAGGADTLGLQLKENGVVVAGPIHDITSSSYEGTLNLHYLNTSPTPGTALAYTVEYYCTGSAIDFQSVHATIGQTQSSIMVEVR